MSGAIDSPWASAAATQILIWVRNSRPIFKVEPNKLSEQFKQLAAQKGVRIALLADADEVRASHQYIEALAGQQGAQVRAFREESRARNWMSCGARGVRRRAGAC